MVIDSDERGRERPLWLFLSEPGLGGLLMKELKFRDVIRQKARPQSWHLRNYDLLVFPDSQIVGPANTSRIALDVLVCPVFGRYKISDRQLDRLAAVAKAEGCDGLVSSVAGTSFQRQDIMRWLEARLGERGARFTRESTRPLRLFIIDESYYFGFAFFNCHQAPGRARDADRHGSLPLTIAAAMCFAANPQTHEVVWDPVAGTGTLLREFAALESEAVLIGSDIDARAIEVAKANLTGIPNVEVHIADSSKHALGRSNLTLTLANLPFGKQFGSPELNASIYEGIFRSSLAHAAPNWRACVITSDERSLDTAINAIPTLSRQKLIAVRVRGREAGIYLVGTKR